MANNQVPDIDKLKTQVFELINNDLPKLIGNRAVKHFRRSFENQGFTDRHLKPWRKTKSGKQNTFGKKSQGILTQSNALKKSIRTVIAKGGIIKITAGYANKVKYAEIHNKGGWVTIPITAESRKFFWYMFYKSKKKDLKWKRMALTKKTAFKFKMPKRQFMGKSEMLNQEIDTLIKRAIKDLR